MKYLLLVCVEQPPHPPLETDEEIAARKAGENEAGENEDVLAWFAEIDKRGSRLIGSQVSQPANAATVRVRDGEVVVSDGPFAETKEWMAGFDVIECASMAEAVEIAALHPVAAFGMIEVRPFLPETWRG
ncbi:MAG TPA: YciI family protein [Streptosporangiaceae bacterium]|nr:YciI family protein [Streptosporangiaceae bacterium]